LLPQCFNCQSSLFTYISVTLSKKLLPPSKLKSNHIDRNANLGGGVKINPQMEVSELKTKNTNFAINVFFGSQPLVTSPPQNLWVHKMSRISDVCVTVHIRAKPWWPEPSAHISCRPFAAPKLTWPVGLKLAHSAQDCKPASRGIQQPHLGTYYLFLLTCTHLPASHTPLPHLKEPTTTPTSHPQCHPSSEDDT
jgi:hypothetical protein